MRQREFSNSTKTDSSPVRFPNKISKFHYIFLGSCTQWSHPWLCYDSTTNHQFHRTKGVNTVAMSHWYGMVQPTKAYEAASDTKLKQLMWTSSKNSLLEHSRKPGHLSSRQQSRQNGTVGEERWLADYSLEKHQVAESMSAWPEEMAGSRGRHYRTNFFSHHHHWRQQTWSSSGVGRTQRPANSGLCYYTVTIWQVRHKGAQ